MALTSEKSRIFRKFQWKVYDRFKKLNPVTFQYFVVECSEFHTLYASKECKN